MAVTKVMCSSLLYYLRAQKKGHKNHSITSTLSGVYINLISTYNRFLMVKLRTKLRNNSSFFHQKSISFLWVGPTWDNYALGTKSHLGRICTWDHDGLGTKMHLGPNHTWDQYAVGTNMHLGPKCTENLYNNENFIKQLNWNHEFSFGNSKYLSIKIKFQIYASKN